MEKKVRRSRVWLLAVIGMYPVLLGLVTVMGHAAPSWPTWERLVAVVPCAAACMVWVVGPVQQRVLARWS